MEGAMVAFEFSSAGVGAGVVPGQKATNGDGLADTRLVLGTSIGPQIGTARVVTAEGEEEIQTSFTAVALSENANSMVAVGGQDQTGHVGQPLDDRLVVEVTDGFGNPVAGVPISWEATTGGGTVSAVTVETDEDGRSRVERILGPAVGPQSTTASSPGLAGSPIVFLHTAVAGDASRLTVVSGNDQTAEIGTLLPASLVVRLVDSEGNGVPNTAVTWVVATGGGTPNPVNTTTDADGLTSTRWTLGPALGEQRIDAVVSGVGFVSFRATATAVAPPALIILTQPSASARNGVRLDRQPVVQLRDAQGNDVAAAGVVVTAALGGGGELEGTTRRTTDASGRVAFDDLAIAGAPGRRTLVFTAVGYAGATSTEIDLQAIPTTTDITGDSPDPSGVGSPFTVSFRVSSQGPVPTGNVTVSDGSQSCTGSLSNGAGSCSLTSTTPGQKTLTATYAGVPGLLGSSDTDPHTVT
ncbi:MAG: Ig-like domain-containing protein, partial [Actinomycetota bacterium]|nr:Ig-like domain-containing protein [Actinomycetota bacterium]